MLLLMMLRAGGWRLSPTDEGLDGVEDTAGGLVGGWGLTHVKSLVVTSGGAGARRWSRKLLGRRALTCLVSLATLRDHDQATVTAPSQEETTVWAHKQSQDGIVLRSLKSSEPFEAGQVTHEDNAFFSAVDKFIDLIGRFNHQRRNDMRRLFVPGFLFDVGVDDRRSINRKGVPVVIIA